MKTIYKIIFSLSIIALFASCEDVNDKLTFEGPAITHFTMSSGSLQAETSADTYSVEVGTTTAEAATIQLSVSATSTAIEGVHFEAFPSSVSIGQGEFVTSFTIVPFPEAMTPGEPVTLVIDIANSTVGAEAVSLPQSFSLEIARLCPSEIPEGTYLETATGAGTEVQLTALGDGRYMLSQMNFAYYSPGYDDIPGEFVDVCNGLTLQGVATEVFGIAWIGTGSYDPATGNLNFSVSDATYNPNYTVEMVFELQ